jgi:hypothetical protein
MSPDPVVAPAALPGVALGDDVETAPIPEPPTAAATPAAPSSYNLNVNKCFIKILKSLVIYLIQII